MKEKQTTSHKSFSSFLLVWVFIVINLFIAAVLFIFYKTSSEPTTLIIAVFGFFGVECGIMGWIKTNKDKEDQKIREKIKEELLQDTIERIRKIPGFNVTYNKEEDTSDGDDTDIQ